MTTHKTTLYKRDSKGKLQEWTICVEGSTYKTIAGKTDGKLVESSPTSCPGTNAGKANELSPEAHAERISQSKITEKLDKGYTYEVPAEGVEKRFETTLAHVFGDHVKKIQGPVLISPKLDGMRCYINQYGMFTRNHKPILSCPHIWNQYQMTMDSLVSRGLVNPEDFILDGELYNHELSQDFNKIISLCKKTKPSQEDLNLSRQLIQYHIFDWAFPDTPFLVRSQRLAKIIFSDPTPINSYFRQVPQSYGGVVIPGGDVISLSNGQVVPFPEYVESVTTHYTNMGYEGAMLRWGDTCYEMKRTDHLLKIKKFISSEYKILDIIEGKGNRSGMAGAILLELPNGKTFQSNITGEASIAVTGVPIPASYNTAYDLYRELQQNKELYIGTQATCKYQNLTPDGVPRFPVVVAIRNYE